MYVELLMVSRKTPQDGLMEVTRRAALPLIGRSSFPLQVDETRGIGEVLVHQCACGPAGASHMHYFLRSALLRSLPALAEVSVQLIEPQGEIIIRSR